MDEAVHKMQNSPIEIAYKTQKLLEEKENKEWDARYAEYVKQILDNEETIKRNKSKFKTFPPLFLYMNVTNAKGQGIFGLRYEGQQVADLWIKDDNVLISTEKYESKNKRDFNCDIELKNAVWKNAEVSKFRKHFKKKPKRNDKDNKGNEEHRIESSLLTMFSEKRSTDKDKLLLYIQPVCLFGGISRFQMPTPLSASGSDIKYSGKNGGGIDILCRVGRGAKTKLCVVEVKDENVKEEPPKKAIKQAIAYAVFLRELLRSPSGEKWYKIFGFNRGVPEKLEIIASVAMPFAEKFPSDFDKIEIPIGNDKLILHSIFFSKKDLKIKKCSFANKSP